MKYLKYILIIIAVLVAIFIGSGILKPAISYESEITVDKSIEEAWAVMEDESKIDQWLQGITKVEHIGGQKGAVGGVTRYTFTENGQESTVVETIKTIQPNDHISMDFNMEGLMNMDYRVDYGTKDGKTHIKSSTTATGEGIFMRSLMSFIQGSMQTEEDENMARLQKLINENTTDYFPEPTVELIEEEQ